MYCSNCGMKLPDWAHYCERCGARLRRDESSDDPLDRVDDGAVAELLWTEEGQAEEEPPAEGPRGGFGMETQFMRASTVRMDLSEAMAEQGDVENPGTPEAAPADAQEGSDVTQRVDAEAMAEAAREGVGGPQTSVAGDAVGDEGEVETGEQPTKKGAQPVERQERPSDAGGRGASRRIDVGDMDGMLPADVQMHHHAPDTWQGRPRPSERRSPDAQIPMKALGIAAVAAIVLGFLAASLFVGGSGSSSSSEGAPAVVMENVSTREANRVIDGLSGWWTTDRELDGRYWHLQDGILETYAADGQLAKQVLVDPTAVKRMATGPGGIEGPGYFLRDIAFYLLDSNQDTLYSINGDGSADESGNLFRSETPSFMTSGDATAEKEPSMEEETVDSSEYLLPESSTRVYSTSELEAMSDHDLFLARNEIYARHGYQFQAGELSEYFASKSWYHPSDVFNEGEITEIERQNVSAILAIEQARGSQYV